MINKQADDKTKRLALLADLKRSPLLDARQKAWLDDELIRVRRGIEGEREAAFYIDSYVKDAKNSVALHDLRFEIDGEVAQIDHLLFNRLTQFILIETKCFNGNLSINDHGEFSVTYAHGKSYGIPSPLEQSNRHERILSKVLDRLEIGGRLGIKPTFTHLVLLHPKAIIKRPSPKAFDTSNVIKADALPTWHRKWLDEVASVSEAFTGLLSIRSADTIKDWSDKLIRQHRPANLLALPEFMAPKATAVTAAEPTPRYAAPTARKGPEETLDMPPSNSASPTEKGSAKRLLCATCGTKISYAEGKFCWNNEKRFNGLQYCREHQQAF
jgi:hypothetical protein